MATVRCLLLGGISAELVLVLLVIDEESELLRRELSGSHFWHGRWGRGGAVQKSSFFLF